MGELAVWWLAVEIVGLAALPLTVLVCANLPGRGWPLAKPLGVLTLGWLIWFPLVSISALPYSSGWIVGAFILYTAGNALLLWRVTRVRAALARLLQRERAYLIASEFVFAASFAFMGWFRSFTPAVKDTEKFMDVAFVSALWRAQHLPAPDPWLSGFPINYYYFGHYLIATLAKALATQPAVAFNCGIALVFALTAVAVFGVGSALYAAARPAGARLSRSIPVGIASGLLVLVLGNLAGFGEWWKEVQGLVASNPKELAAGPWAFWLHRDLWQTYFYWPPSRVIPGTINEFPAFSFVLADLHAHILALPFAALAVGLALNLLLSRGRGLHAFGPGAAAWLALPVVAICIGGLYAINGWDLPTYLGLALLALALQQWIAHGRAWSSEFVLNTVAAGAVLSVLCLVVYLPFYAGFVSPQQGFGLVPADQRSLIGDEVQIYGLYAFILFSLLALWLARWLVTTFRAWTADAMPGSIWWRIRDQEGAAAGIAVGVPLALLLLLTRASAGATIWTLLWCLLVIAACAVLARARLAPRPALAGSGAFAAESGDSPSAVASTPAGGAAARARGEPPRVWSEERTRRAELWVLVLVGTAAALVAVCELVFLRDIFGTRMNTVFKLYFQAWLLLGIAGGPALAWLLAGAWRTLSSFAPAAAVLADRTPERAEPTPGASLAFASGKPAPTGWLNSHPDANHGPLTPRRESWPQALRRNFMRRPLVPFSQSPSEAPASPAHSRPSHASVPSAGSAARSPANGPASLRRLAAGGILIWMAALVVLVGMALVFPVLASSNQTANFSLPHSLDGAAYMATDPTYVPADCSNYIGAGSNAHDNEAIAWLNAHITGSPVIVEAPGCEWSHYSRISAFTGLPTLIGWPGGHEGEWRTNWVQRTGEYGIFNRRTAAVNQIYSDPDNQAVLALLRQYHVRLLYVGAAERNLYPQADLNRFGSFLHVIYNRDGVTIYAVPA
jgi:YYY domain-containing protein